MGLHRLLLATLLFYAPIAIAWQAVELNQSHQTWLTRNGPVRYCVDPHWLPFEAIVDQRHQGMSRNYVDLVSAILNHPFQLVPTESWRQSLEFLSDGRCQLIPMLNQTAERNRFVLFTEVYFRNPVVLIVRDDQRHIRSHADLQGKTLAVVDGYMPQEYLGSRAPHITTIAVSTELEGLNRISAGEIDSMALSLLSATYYIQQAGLSNLHIADDLDIGDEFRMGVNAGTPELRTLLDLALGQITTGDHNQIFQTWNPISISRATDYTLTWQVASALTALLLVLTERLLTGRRLRYKLQVKNAQLLASQQLISDQNIRLAHAANHDNLTGLLNRKAMNDILAEEIQRWQRRPFNLSILLIDLDEFKPINDQHGHQAGDQALQFFAQVLGQTIRNTDKACRWGGDEFLVLSNHGEAAELRHLAERLQNNLVACRPDQQPPVHCSIGIASFREGDNFKCWFERADQALYLAKRQGGRGIQVESPGVESPGVELPGVEPPKVEPPTRAEH